MSAAEIAIAVLITPVSALLIGAWVLSSSRKITAEAHRRAKLHRNG